VESSGEDLDSLREAHQKLLAEVISLRAKAASVSDEEYEVQREIKSMAKEIGKLSMELSALKESVMEVKVKLGESVSVLKVQIGKKE
jgi:peptidoglycan hydrolase CwlO-like protein